jgi:phage terminase large subunit-like protein
MPDALQRIISAASAEPNLTFEIQPDGLRISGIFRNVMGSQKIPYEVLECAVTDPLPETIDKLARRLGAVAAENLTPIKGISDA